MSQNNEEQYRTLIRHYLGHPASSVPFGLEMKLSAVERNLLTDPPLKQDAEDNCFSHRQGILSIDEARAGATSEGLATLYDLDLPMSPRIRDDFKLVPERDWNDAIAEKKKNEAMSRALVEDFTLDQDFHGSCGSEGYSGGVIGCEAKQSNAVVEKLNALALYGLVNGGHDGGSSLSDNVAAGAKYGVPSERVWPRSNGWRKKLSDEAKHDALRHRIDEHWRVHNKLEMGTALILGMFCYAGYSGHAWYAVDPVDDKRFRYHNSWGKEWADKGFATLRYSSVMWSYGVWAFRTSRLN